MFQANPNLFEKLNSTSQLVQICKTYELGVDLLDEMKLRKEQLEIEK